jgi:uncharacterized damage-inducible protein DinB
MRALHTMRRMWEHAAWADRLLLGALLRLDPCPSAVWREYAHVLGAESVWLDRLLRRAARFAVWPTLEPAAAAALAESLRAEYIAFIDGLTSDALDAPVSYVNSAGIAFETPVEDILLQVFLHGQYHRGKINLMLRQSREEPVPTDYIAFARGVPAAITPPAAVTHMNV